MYTIKFTTTVHVTLPVQLTPTRHKHERRAARARKCGHACASMQARACTTLSQRTHRSRPKSWATAHGDARAVEHEVVALRRPARREPAREAREGRGGVSKVVAVRCEEGWLWGTGWHWCARARPRRADSAPRPPSPSTIAPHDAPLSGHQSRSRHLPQGALAVGRLRAGGRGERQLGSSKHRGGRWGAGAVAFPRSKVPGAVKTPVKSWCCSHPSAP